MLLDLEGLVQSDQAGQGTLCMWNRVLAVRESETRTGKPTAGEPGRGGKASSPRRPLGRDRAGLAPLPWPGPFTHAQEGQCPEQGPSPGPEASWDGGRGCSAPPQTGSLKKGADPGDVFCE